MDNRGRDIALEAAKIFFDKDKTIQHVFDFIDSKSDDQLVRLDASARLLVSVIAWFNAAGVQAPGFIIIPKEDNNGSEPVYLQERLFD